MTALAFVDTNIAIYAFGQDGAKVAAAEKLLSGKPTISAQVVNEFLNVCRVKLGMNIAEKQSVSHWDALIVAAALLAGCATLHSEDMQHGQLFEGQLTVINPFLVS